MSVINRTRRRRNQRAYEKCLEELLLGQNWNEDADRKLDNDLARTDCDTADDSASKGRIRYRPKTFDSYRSDSSNQLSDSDIPSPCPRPVRRSSPTGQGDRHESKTCAAQILENFCNSDDDGINFFKTRTAGSRPGSWPRSSQFRQERQHAASGKISYCREDVDGTTSTSTSVMKCLQSKRHSDDIDQPGYMKKILRKVTTVLTQNDEILELLLKVHSYVSESPAHHNLQGSAEFPPMHTITHSRSRHIHPVCRFTQDINHTD